MQQTIAEHLRLDLSTVANFFMNARRRSRSGPLVGDAPAPYQQVILVECFMAHCWYYFSLFIYCEDTKVDYAEAINRAKGVVGNIDEACF